MTLDDVIREMYASMCFEPGGKPDWERQAQVFVLNARLVRLNDDGVFEFDPRTFRQNFEHLIESGALPGFWEGELWRVTDEYADFAHVLSAYEMGTSRTDPKTVRAIKSIQLYKQHGRWWISAMLWRREGRSIRIPDVHRPSA